MGRTPRIKKEPFRKDSKNQDIKKNPQGSYGILVEKEQVSRLLPLDTLYPEDYGVAVGGFAQQSA